MAVFHRLTVPTYFGGLPAGFDYINNAISGTPANADGQKGSGVNSGTYFIAFGEDATSSDANRPNQALAQNTDYLDNLLHQDLAVNTRTADVTPGSPVASITITGPGIFIGGVGDTLMDLFHITDTSDNDIDVSGTQVVVASISGGTLGTGFSAGNITLTLNISIPTGQAYRVWYGTRSNLATLPQDAFTTLRIRSAVQVDEQVEELFRLLHGNGEAWNAPWDNTIYGLNQGLLSLQTILANLHGNGEAYNATWDATVYDLNYDRRQRPLINWRAGVSTNNHSKRGYYSILDQVWFAVGNTASAELESSRDFGKSWTAVTTGIGASYDDVAVDSSGNIVIISETNNAIKGTRTAYNTFTWATSPGVMTGTPDIDAGRVGWDSTAALFVYLYRVSGGAGFKVDTSPNGTTITNRTVPGVWSGYGGSNNPELKVVPGVAIACFVDVPNTCVQVMKSTNGGVSWTNVSVPFTVSATTIVVQPAYDPLTHTWFVAAYDTVSGQTQVAFSTDNGTTWSAPSLHGPLQLHGIGCLPGVMGGVDRNLLAYVTVPNLGTTLSGPPFYLVTALTGVTAVTQYMREGGGGLMVFQPSNKMAWPSDRVGNVAAELSTPI